MKKLLLTMVLLLIVFSGVSLAAPSAPSMSYTTSGLELSIEWDTVSDATGYKLYYAPFPYTGPESIRSIDVEKNTTFDFTLWEGAAFYIAVKALNDQGESDYSNIDYFIMGPPNPEWVDDDGDGFTEVDGDCDDTSEAVNPEGIDRCGDGIDQDCSGGDRRCPVTVGGSGRGTTESSEAILLATEIISTEGGIIEVFDETTLDLVASVEVPPNALASAQTITISQISPPEAMSEGSYEAGETYQFGPEGLIFNVPVLVTLPFNDLNNDGTIEGTTTADNDVGVRYYNASTGLWEDVTVVSLDRDLNLVTFSTDHFSVYTPWIPVKNELPRTTQVVYNTIIVDGDPSDWQGLRPLKIDLPNDTYQCQGIDSGYDLKYVYSAMDDQYAYFFIEVHDPPINPNAQVYIRSSLRFDTEDLSYPAYADIGNGFNGPQDSSWPNGSSAWDSQGGIYAFDSPTSAEGHITAWGEGLEVRIPLSSLPGAVEHYNPVFITVVNNNSTNVCDKQGFYPSVNWFAPTNMNDETLGEYQYLGLNFMNRNAEMVSEHILNKAIVEYPSGKTVELLADDMVFRQFETIYGRYLTDQNKFDYQTYYEQEGDYLADLNEELEVGDYLLRAYDRFGNEYTRTTSVEQLISIPYVDTNTLRTTYGLDGSLTATWVLPTLPASVNDYQFKAYVETYSNGELQRFAWVNIPVDLGRLEVPGDVMQSLKEGADEVKLRLRINTKTGNNRSHTRSVTIPFQ